jgi:hypothetical protein
MNVQGPPIDLTHHAARRVHLLVVHDDRGQNTSLSAELVVIHLENLNRAAVPLCGSAEVNVCHRLRPLLFHNCSIAITRNEPFDGVAKVAGLGLALLDSPREKRRVRAYQFVGLPGW